MKEVKVVKVTADMKIGDFGLDVGNEPISVATFISRADRFLFNDPVQRNSCWTLKQKSELIVSVLNGLPVPEIVAEIVRKNKKKFYNILDGKQRMTTLRDFKKNKFKLSKDTSYVICVDDEGNEFKADISELTYEELPESFRNKIDEFTFIIKPVDIPADATEEEREEIKKMIFKNLNSGSTLKPVEKRKVLMSFEQISRINEIKNKDIFTFGISETQQRRDTNAEAVQQAIAILITNGDTGIDSKALDALFVEGKLTNEVFNETSKIADYLSEAMCSINEKSLKEVVKKTKITAMFLAGKEGLSLGIPTDEFAEWTETFFHKEYDKRGFKHYSSGSTASGGNVKRRCDVMMKDFKETFAEYYNKQQNEAVVSA